MSRVVAYDFLQVPGGAEALSRLLAARLDAELLVHSCTAGMAPAAGTVPAFTRLSKRPTSARVLPRALAAWRGFRRAPCREDVRAVLFSGHYAPLAWRAFPRARRVLYLHGVPLPWLATAESGHESSVLLKAGLGVYGRALRRAAREMHLVLANSRFTAERFERVTGVPARVVQPPVDAAFFALLDDFPDHGYWMSWARHEPGKRIGRVIDAFARMPDEHLLVAGHGSASASLMARARGAPNIHFTGALDRRALLRTLRGAAGALHVAEHEPYGLAIAEAVAAGRYVIAADDGGVRDIIPEPSFAHLLAADPTVPDIIAAVRAARPHLRPDAQRLPPTHLTHTDDFVASIQSALEPAQTR